jgi:hypothetical protein
VHLELPLPPWLVPEEDLDVQILGQKLTGSCPPGGAGAAPAPGLVITVDGYLRLHRRMWRSPDPAAAQQLPVNLAAATWVVEQVAAPPAAPAAAGGRQAARGQRVLAISLPRWELTPEEVQYKKGACVGAAYRAVECV